MRILASADIHGVLGVYEWLVQISIEHSADLLILAGDLFAADSDDEQRQQAKRIVSILAKGSCPCFYLMGNDDNVALEYEDAQIRPLHGRRLALGALNFVGYEYSPPFFGSVFVKRENEIEKDLEALAPLLDSQSVLVTHAPALGGLDRCVSGERVGSTATANLLERTSVLAHIHGHIHEDFGRQGNSFNVAAAGQRRCMLIELPARTSRVLREE